MGSLSIPFPSRPGLGIHPETLPQFTTAVQLLPLPLLPHLLTLEYDAREAYIAIGIWLNPYLIKLKLTLKDQRRADCLWAIRSIRHHSTSLELRFIAVHCLVKKFSNAI